MFAGREKGLHQKINEGARAGGLIAALRIVDEQVGRRQREIGQHHPQPAAFQVFGQIPFRPDQDAVAVQGPAQNDVTVVAGKPAFDLHHLYIALMREAPDAVRFVVLPVKNALVMGEVGKGGGRAVRLQVVRRGAKKAAIGHDAPRGKTFVGEFAEADGQVEAAFHQVDGTVGHLQFDLDLRIAPCKVRDQRRDGRAAETQRGIDADKAARLHAAARHHVLHFPQVGKDPGRVGQIGFTFIGQTDAARRAVDQPHAEALFHQREPLGGRRRRQVQLPRRCGQAAQPRDQHKKLQL